MNMNDIHAEDWEYIFKCYPGLESKMIACSLVNEKKRLQTELDQNCFIYPERKTWVENRLIELQLVLLK